MLRVGNLAARRDFVHVDDGAEALRAARRARASAARSTTWRAAARSSIARGARAAAARSPASTRAGREDPERLRPVDLPLLAGDAARLARARLAAAPRARRGARRALARGAGRAGRRHESPAHRRHRLPRPARRRAAGAASTSCACWCGRARRASAFRRASSSPPATSPTVPASSAPSPAATPSCTPRRWSRSWRRRPSSTASTSAGSRTCSPRREAAGVRRILYVSSFIALGPTESGPGGVLDESAPSRGDRAWINDYERTKTLADRRARGARSRHGAPLAVVYPGVIYGPGELTEGNIVVRHLLDLAHGRLPALLGRPERRWNYVFVDDVAAGVAARPRARAAPGGALRARRRERHPGRVLPPRRRARPACACRSAGCRTGSRRRAGAAMKGWARLTGGDAAAHARPGRDLPPRLGATTRSRAERELGYSPRSLRDGLARDVRLAAGARAEWPR